MLKKKRKVFCLALGNMKINHYLCGIIASINKMDIQLTYRRTSRLSMRIVKNGDVHVSVSTASSMSGSMSIIPPPKSMKRLVLIV